MDAQAAQEGDDAVDNLTKELDEVVVKIKGITAQMADARVGGGALPDQDDMLRRDSLERAT